MGTSLCIKLKYHLFNLKNNFKIIFNKPNDFVSLFKMGK